MKRGIFIFALLTATLALLAGIIIPHHHHEDKICFADSHCDAACNHQDSDSDSDHQAAEKCGDHHDAKKSQCQKDCLLDIEILLPPQQDVTGAEFFICLDDHSSFDGIAALPMKLALDEQLLPVKLISHSPPILEYDSRYVIGSPGLRAPPVC